MRRDIWELTEYASSLGFGVVYATNGLLIDRHTDRRMRRSGVLGAAISLDSTKPSKYDAFRGVPGAWRELLGVRGMSLKRGCIYK